MFATSLSWWLLSSRNHSFTVDVGVVFTFSVCVQRGRRTTLLDTLGVFRLEVSSKSYKSDTFFILNTPQNDHSVCMAGLGHNVKDGHTRRTGTRTSRHAFRESETDKEKRKCIIVYWQLRFHPIIFKFLYSLFSFLWVLLLNEGRYRFTKSWHSRWISGMSL